MALWKVHYGYNLYSDDGLCNRSYDMGDLGYDPDNIRTFIINKIERDNAVSGKVLRILIAGVFPNLDLNYLDGLLDELVGNFRIKEIEYIVGNGIHRIYLPKAAQIRGIHYESN